MNKHKLQLTIYVSAMLVSAGVFLPLTEFPVYGEITYNRMAPVESWLVVIFAMAGPGFILGGKPRWSFLCPLGVWGVLLFPALEGYYRSLTDTTLRQVGSSLNAAMSDFAANLFLEIAEFHWGGFLLLLSLLVYTIVNLLYQLRY